MGLRIGDKYDINHDQAYYADAADAYTFKEALDTKHNQQQYPDKIKYKQKYTKDQDGNKIYEFTKHKFKKLDANIPLDYATIRAMAYDLCTTVEPDGSTTFLYGLTQDILDNDWKKAKDVVKWIEDNLELYFIDEIANIEVLP